MKITFVKGPIDREVRELDGSKFLQGGDIFVLDPKFLTEVRAGLISSDDKANVPQHKYRMASTPEGPVAVYQGVVE